MADQQKELVKEKPSFGRYNIVEQKKSSGGVAILNYGSNNNFHLHKGKLSDAALKEFGYLSLLIKQGKYYVPKFIQTTPIPDLSSKQQEVLEVEALKRYFGLIKDMNKNRPKIYGLIMHLEKKFGKNLWKLTTSYHT